MNVQLQEKFLASINLVQVFIKPSDALIPQPIFLTLQSRAQIKSSKAGVQAQSDPCDLRQITLTPNTLASSRAKFHVCHSIAWV